MPVSNPIKEHGAATRNLARLLNRNDVHFWLLEKGYFPESYVLPPCFAVTERPHTRKKFFDISRRGKMYKVDTHQCAVVHFPKSELTDRNFGIIHPHIHNDIAYQITQNWKTIVSAMMPSDSLVTAYSFPIPIDSKNKGRMGFLRSGRMIYEFLSMTDDHLSAVAYQYTHIVKADIKNFYGSIYTHSLAWALHGKNTIRKSTNLHNYNLLGNRLDRLFQRANDGCTNGIPIGPVVSDIAAEIVAGAVDVVLSKEITRLGIECEMVRFKDDYKILVKSDSDGRIVIKCIQKALKAYNLEISEGKTSISSLPNGLFRDWVSEYHAVHPYKRKYYSWKAFRELYLSVLRIDCEYPGTGVIDRFLADIVSTRGSLKVTLSQPNLQKVISMLLLLANRRVKSFPKVLAIVEAVLITPFGKKHEDEIFYYLQSFLDKLAEDEDRNLYLICWVSYFLVSNRLKSRLTIAPVLKDKIARSVFSNRSSVFNGVAEFKLFQGSIAASKKHTMMEYLDIFSPPESSI